MASPLAHSNCSVSSGEKWKRFVAVCSWYIYCTCLFNSVILLSLKLTKHLNDTYRLNLCIPSCYKSWQSVVLVLLAAVFASQPSIGLMAPLPRYRSTAAAADGFAGHVSPVLSPQAVPLNTSTPSPVCSLSSSLSLCDICDLTTVHKQCDFRFDLSFSFSFSFPVIF